MPCCPTPPARPWLAARGLWLAVAAHGALAQTAPPLQAEPVLVAATRSANLVGAADTATEGRITAQQLATRPLLRAAEVLESVPGLTVTQHSGDGKANQYFLRGFNLDHGSDFATLLDGVPVNSASHAHGQGYTDLNFLIPELVAGVAYRKGSYSALDGDFAVTGTARISTLRRLPAPLVDLTLGAHHHARLLAAGSTPLGAPADGGPTLLAALELAHANGPRAQPEHLQRRNAVLRLSQGTAAEGWALTAMAYHARWTATEHVPERAILGGEIGRYGTLAPTDGGITHRHSLSAEGAWRNADSRTEAQAHVVDYGLNLFSSPSGLQDSQHEQADRRVVLGGQLLHTWLLGPAWQDTDLTLGATLRHDRLPRQGLFSTQDRVRTGTVREDRVQQTQAGLLAEARSSWQPWLRSTLGLRLDAVRARVTPLAGTWNAANGGTVQGHQLSPKLALALGPWHGSELYASWGRGFHSNDMRGATTRVNPGDGSAVDAVPPLARATSAELGLRTSPLPGWHSALSLWRTRLASELVFVGDEGVTEPKGASRRQGLEWWNDWTATPWLTVDADLALSQARFTQAADNGGHQVPNAIPRSASLGLAADAGGPWFGGLRLRHIGAYPLEETGQQRSTPSTTVNARLGWRAAPGWQLTLDLLNAFNRRAHDIEYWGSSCTRAEGAGCNGGAGIDGRLVHPLEPRTLRASLRASF